MTLAQIEHGLMSTLNGMGNIYHVNATALLKLDR